MATKTTNKIVLQIANSLVRGYKTIKSRYQFTSSPENGFDSKASTHDLSSIQNRASADREITNAKSAGGQKPQDEELSQRLNAYKNSSNNSAPQTQAPAQKDKATLPKNVKFFRPTNLTSRYYYSRALRTWHWLMLSLPFDLLLLIPNFDILRMLDPSALIEMLGLSLVLLIGISFIFLAREQIINLLLKADHTKNKLISLSSKHSLIVLALVVLLVFIKIAAEFGISLFGVIAALVITTGAARSIKRTIKEKHSHHSRMQEDRTLWVEETNRKVFLIAIAPQIAARLISPIGGMLALLSFNSELVFCMYVLLALIFLLINHPQERHFIILCKSCGIKTSIILKDKGLCPNCEIASSGRIKAAIPTKNLTKLPPPVKP